MSETKKRHVDSIRAEASMILDIRCTRSRAASGLIKVKHANEYVFETQIKAINALKTNISIGTGTLQIGNYALSLKDETDNYTFSVNTTPITSITFPKQNLSPKQIDAAAILLAKSATTSADVLETADCIEKFCVFLEDNFPIRLLFLSIKGKTRIFKDDMDYLCELLDMKCTTSQPSSQTSTPMNIDTPMPDDVTLMPWLEQIRTRAGRTLSMQTPVRRRISAPRSHEYLNKKIQKLRIKFVNLKNTTIPKFIEHYIKINYNAETGKPLYPWVAKALSDLQTLADGNIRSAIETIDTIDTIDTTASKDKELDKKIKEIEAHNYAIEMQTEELYAIVLSEFSSGSTNFYDRLAEALKSLNISSSGGAGPLKQLPVRLPHYIPSISSQFAPNKKVILPQLRKQINENVANWNNEIENQQQQKAQQAAQTVPPVPPGTAYYDHHFNEYILAYERAQKTGLSYINPYSRFITRQLSDKFENRSVSIGGKGGSRHGKGGLRRQKGGAVTVDEIKHYVKLLIFCLLAFFGLELNGLRGLIEGSTKQNEKYQIKTEETKEFNDLLSAPEVTKHLNPLFDLLNSGDLTKLATQYNNDYEQIDQTSGNKDALFYVIDNFVYQKQLESSEASDASGGGSKFKNPLTGRLIDPKGATALKLLKLHVEGSIKLPRKICSVIKSQNK